MDQTTLLELRRRSNAACTAPYNGLPVQISGDPDSTRIHAVLDPRSGHELAQPDTTFNIFDRAHEWTALELSRTFSGIARAQPDEAGLRAVLDAAIEAFKTQNSDLVKFALCVFITNDPLGRGLYIPPVIQQSPEIFIPLNQLGSSDLEPLGGLGEEAVLDYFREDPDFNAHHTQWHRVYPALGSLNPDDPTGPRIAKDRQGELFWYMHQQMLARYDTERIALNMAPAVAFDDYRALIPEGYWAEENIADRYDGRVANGRISNVRFNLGQGRVLEIADMEALRDQLRDAAQTGEFEVDGASPIQLTADTRSATLLGATLEASIGGVAVPSVVTAIGGLHNTGHSFFSALSGARGGVMRDPAAAVRDPVFYRWHRHVDNLFVAWQQQLAAYELGLEIPPVKLRKGLDGQSIDLGLALLQDLAPGLSNGADFDGAAFGAAQFGGATWDTPLADFVGDAGKPLTRMLETNIGTYPLVLKDGRSFTIYHLDNAEFAYFLRLENTADSQQRVTVRIFLAARERADDRRWWIEMDRFLEVLEPRSRAVIYRPARLSSVVRKPARRPGEPGPGPEHPNDDYCNCGWPYHMLLPRGRERAAGMPFRLLVMLTDAVNDLEDTQHPCGSISFCGSRDQKYPDNRMMGYPFDRSFRDRTITEAIADPSFTHLAALDFAIHHTPSSA